MTDRELLERAARAIGATEYGGPDDCRPAGVVLLNGVPTNYEGHGEFGFAWNPLIYDGDALHLAVMLAIRVDFQFRNNQPVIVCCTGEARTNEILELAGPGEHLYAAARRAIVRAAAAMAPEVAS